MIVPAVRRFFLLTAFSLTPIAARADASCTEVFDAGVRDVETPHHIYYTKASDKADGRSMESIFDGRAIYSNAKGTWQKSETAHGVMLENAHEKRQKLDATCTRVGTESIDGQSATHWHIKPDSDSDAAESDLWIGEKGLPIHQRMVMPDRATRDVRIDYTDVKAPLG